jgi:aspartate 4-decarboxylase
LTASSPTAVIEITPSPMHAAYYGLIDFEYWLKKYVGKDVVQYVKQHVHPLDMVFRLAEDHASCS